MKFKSTTIGRRGNARTRTDRQCSDCGKKLYKSNVKDGVLICTNCNSVYKE